MVLNQENVYHKVSANPWFQTMIYCTHTLSLYQTIKVRHLAFDIHDCTSVTIHNSLFVLQLHFLHHRLYISEKLQSFLCKGAVL
jgi:hypothetical protein